MSDPTEIRMDSREHFGDDLAPILAAEEHRRGLPYIEGDHCADCLEVDRAWDQATCDHAEWVDISYLGDINDVRLCNQCGYTWEAE